MSDEDALLQGIIENPDADAPRLVYADWLEEHGQQERADFVRWKHRLANTAEDDEHHRILLARVKELQQGHVGDWVEHCGLPLTWDNALAAFR